MFLIEHRARVQFVKKCPSKRPANFDESDYVCTVSKWFVGCECEQHLIFILVECRFRGELGSKQTWSSCISLRSFFLVCLLCSLFAVSFHLSSVISLLLYSNARRNVSKYNHRVSTNNMITHDDFYSRSLVCIWRTSWLRVRRDVVYVVMVLLQRRSRASI